MTNRIFLVGDFKTNTGPAIANKALKKALIQKDTMGVSIEFSGAKSRIGRVLEVLLATIKSDMVCYCGFSGLNAFGVRIAKLFKKKSAYLMHGYVELESKLNGFEVKPRRIEAERYILKNADVLICVSNLLATEVKKRFSKRKNVYVVYDIVEPPIRKRSVRRNRFQIMTTGGGMLRKNNLIVCEAIKKLNKVLPGNKKIEFVITGKSYGLRRELKKYGFVKYMGEASHEKCLELMDESAIYVQNSLFETFGLAVIEAAGCGCDLLISANIGAREVIKNKSNESIILDCRNVDEISHKILRLVKNDKDTRLSVDWEKISSSSVRSDFINIVEDVL